MKVLAVGAHPDDIEILCAGTLCKFRKAGHKVFMCAVCKGDKGHFKIPGKKLAAIRRKEALASAKILGAKFYGGFAPDLELFFNAATIREMVKIMRAAKPDLVITHSPNDYMRDHTVTSRLAVDASFIATLPNYRTGQPPTKVIPPVFFMDNEAGVDFQPTEYVDITNEMSVKVKMLLCHRSQYTWLKEHDNIDYVEFMKKLSIMRGMQCGVKYAEGFRQHCVWGRMKPYRLLP